MPNSWKGVIAGFFATVILSAIFLSFKALGILPELDIVQHIDKLGSIQMAAAWVDHFIVGTLLWGPIFTAFDATTDERRPRWQKGLVFGVLAWVAMMVIFMPVIGAGLFGWRLGLVEPVGMLGLHLVYGLVLGVVFEFLDKRYPAKSILPPTFAADSD
ncbi:MAG TPA: DUF6789 family protein [Xanthobacteraceae bacterium]|nr:DUF6789 family protein [Xanthobacteraceae bacterium]